MSKLLDIKTRILDEKAKLYSLGKDDNLVVVLHPGDIAELLKDIHFANVVGYEPQIAIRNGEIGKIYGVPVLISNTINQGTLVFVKEKSLDTYEFDYNPSKRFQKWKYQL